ncbi:hypothetical protein C8J56DRAFT_1039644 [Mycena floridula]|nr:hypothetical protein C8J56DRAFT_1039644 [Mycena floridula]
MAYSIDEQRREMLDKLHEIPLRGFQEIDVTPTSMVTSLPTPNEEHTVHPGVQLPPDTPSSYLSTFDFEIHPPPMAPRIKDLDSFTEGTAVGSFESIAAGSTDEFGHPIVPINSLSLSLLPPQDTALSIEMWRTEVHSYSEEPHPPTPSPTIKRRRSSAPEDDEGRNRARARLSSPTTSYPNVFNNLAIYGSSATQLTAIHHRSYSAPPD